MPGLAFTLAIYLDACGARTMGLGLRAVFCATDSSTDLFAKLHTVA